MSMTEEAGDYLDQLIRSIEAKAAANKLRLENPWVLHLIKVLWPYSRFGLRRADVMDRIRQIRVPKDLPVPKNYEQTIQSAFNRYSEDSDVFRRRNAPLSEALFFSPGGKGSGKWSVHRDRATEWLKAKDLPIA
jgi:hypothetical protein